MSTTTDNEELERLRVIREREREQYAALREAILAALGASPASPVTKEAVVRDLLDGDGWDERTRAVFV